MRKFKLFGTLLLAGMLTVNTFAIGLNINNKAVTCTQKPVMENGTTLVPLRVISENLGAEVKWDKSTKTVTVVKGDKIIILTIGSKTAKVNNETVTLAQAPKVINGSTMLPIRFVSEQLDCDVLWDSKTQTVYVTEDGVEAQIPDTTDWKTTTIKNPKVINGKVYLTGAQLKDALGLAIAKEDGFVSVLKRKDFEIWLYTGSKGYNRFTGVHVPTKQGDRVVRQGGTSYYPIEYLAEYTNSAVSYANNTATIISKGYIPARPTTSEQYNTVHGYVYDDKGNPVKGAEVCIGWETQNNFGDIDGVDNVFTNANGYYEFKDIDTSKYSTIQISASKVINGIKYEANTGSMMREDGGGMVSGYCRIPSNYTDDYNLWLLKW